MLSSRSRTVAGLPTTTNSLSIMSAALSGELNRQIVELQKLLSRFENVQQALVVGVAERRDLPGRLMQELVIEIFDVLRILLLRLAIGFRDADQLQE